MAAEDRRQAGTLLEDPAAALRAAAAHPRTGVDPAAVLHRAGALRRRRAGWSTAAVVALLAPLVALALTRPGDVVGFAGQGEGAVEATLAGREPPPVVLADGSPVGAVPGAVAARFPGPVVAARKDAALAASPPAPCRGTPLGRSGEEHAAEVGARLDALAAGARPVAAHVGPAIATTLAVGQGRRSGAYSGAFAAVCVSRHDGDGWRSEGLGVDHLYGGWTAGSHHGEGGVGPRSVWVTALPVPPGAAWAVQEQPGWWLAYDVAGDDWVLAHVADQDAAGGDDPPPFPGARVVFAGVDGRLLDDHDTGDVAIPADAPLLRPQVVGGRLELGRATQLRARLASDARPLPVCSEDHGVCVWLIAAGDDLLALAAAGPHPLDVPPLGTVAYCPAEHTFQGTSTRSVFDAHGRLLGGPAPTGLPRYEVVEQGAVLAVDLEAFSYGPEPGGDPRPGATPCADPLEAGG